jgi:heme-binding NEAT domain protein
MLKKQFSFLAIISALIFSLVFVPIDSASAQADGTYNNVRYEVKQSGSNNTSIADGYFSKPAKVTVSGGTKTVQITLTGADMIKSLSVNGAPVTVVSDSGKTRVVKFNVSGDLYSRIPMKMHIVVPDMYDTTHTADLLITDLGSSSSGSSSTATSTSLGNGDKNADNPKTSDNSPIVLYSLLLVGAVGALVLVRKLRPTSN